MTAKMASNMDDTIGGSQPLTQSQSLLAKNYVDTVMASPGVVKVDTDQTRLKRALSGNDIMDDDNSKKIKPSDFEQASNSDSSNFDIVTFMKSEFSTLKSDLSTELNQSLDKKFDALGAKIKTAVLEAVKEDIDALRTEFNDRISGLSNKLETKLTQVLKGRVESEVSKAKETIRAELDASDTARSYAAVTSVSENPILRNVCIRNMCVDSRKTSDSQVTMNKVNSLIRDGLKLKDIKVLKAERKGSYHGKPGVIIASIETVEQKGKVMETKKELKKTNAYKKVYIEDDRPIQTRVAESNMRTILKEIGKSDNYVFSTGRLFKRSNAQ